MLALVAPFSLEVLSAIYFICILNLFKKCTVSNRAYFGLMIHTNIRNEMTFATDALKLVVSECKPKAKIVDLCEKGDSFIRE